MTVPTALIASIPSPSFNTIDIWPRPLTLYGLMIGLGIIAATVMARPRLAARRIHPDTAVEILMWVIPAGVIGARLYHVITDTTPLSEWHEIWNGGLGIPGGIAGGVLGGLLFIRQRGLPRTEVFDALVPVLPLAQAIGRWGNWWNQELYGRPTDLPWGLEIDFEHRIHQVDPETNDVILSYRDFETFHPTFLYESLWNLALCAGLVLIDRRRVLRPGALVWVYVGVYAIGRFWIELLRIDPATEILGARVNLWLMGVLLVLSAVMLWRSRSDQSGTDTREPVRKRAKVAAVGGGGRNASAGDDDYAEDLADLDGAVDDDDE